LTNCGSAAPVLASAWATKLAACCCTRRYSVVSAQGGGVRRGPGSPGRVTNLAGGRRARHAEGSIRDPYRRRIILCLTSPVGRTRGSVRAALQRVPPLRSLLVRHCLTPSDVDIPLACRSFQADAFGTSLQDPSSPRSDACGRSGDFATRSSRGWTTRTTSSFDGGAFVSQVLTRSRSRSR
jgi:hypothetical protein